MNTSDVKRIIRRYNEIMAEEERKELEWSFDEDNTGIAYQRKGFDDICKQIARMESRDPDYSVDVALTLMDGVNCTFFSPCEAGEAMAKEHRYLQNEAFKMCVAFIEALARNGYDGRNEYAHKLSKELVPVIKNFVFYCDK